MRGVPAGRGEYKFPPVSMTREIATPRLAERQNNVPCGMEQPVSATKNPPRSGTLTVHCQLSTVNCFIATGFLKRMCYYGTTLVGSNRITAAVASSSPALWRRIRSASSPAGICDACSAHAGACPSSTPSLISTSTSPLHRDSRAAVSRVSPKPGGGAAVPIFSARPRRIR